MTPRIAILYHFLHPDDVVSARHLGDLCAGLAERGWQVTAHPCNRACREASQKYPRRTSWQGVDIRRVWRPPLAQSSSAGRIVNSGWMLAAWLLRSLGRAGRETDVVMIGTDPIMSVLVAPWIRRFRPRTRIAHWCFDLYPEALVAGGMLREGRWAYRAVKRRADAAYGACDLIADIGPCMREKLGTREGVARQVTLTPWALSEPGKPAAPQPEAAGELFGEHRLGLLYSGTFGRAHTHEAFLALAERLRDSGVTFCFAVRGNRAAELQRAVDSGGPNVTSAPFVEEAGLARQLAAADVHLVSLRPEWSGLVVPSKFFGALAAGRPVLFAGSRDSSVARWIDRYRVGWVLDDSSLQRITRELGELSRDPARLRALQHRCHSVYRERFSRDSVLAGWDAELRRLLEP